ncbi:MAG: T9SS type A sorting domain-containing protein [Bacteroidota bacterium]|nr:T9SS type A sorting domain-containing protein [Bacteroidota bacterium]
MKNFIITAFLSIYAITATAQVVVVGDNFIYSQGVNLFSKGSIDLNDADSRIYLREEAQLIQNDNVSNAGDGFISIFQEGTADQFNYNYWSAPVGDVATASGNEGFSMTQIYYPTGILTGTAADDENYFNRTITAENANFLNYNARDGVSDDGTATNPLEIASRWIYNYDSAGNAIPGNAYSGWNYLGGSGFVNAGYGFSMKGVSGTNGIAVNPNLREYQNGQIGQRYDFRGRPNNGNITVGVADDEVSLVGNPYPSALDLKQFLFENSTVRYGVGSDPAEVATVDDTKLDPSILFWQSNASGSHMLTAYEGGYGIYSPDGYDVTAPGSGTFATEGNYVPAAFYSYDNSGNPITNTSPGLASPVGATLRYAPVGQGFMIRRNASGFTAPNGTYFPPTANLTTGTALPSGTNGEDQIVFTNTQRDFVRESGGNSLMLRGSGNGGAQNSAYANQSPKFRMNVIINDTYTRQLLLTFRDNLSLNYDSAVDARVPGLLDTDIFVNVEGGAFSIAGQKYDEDMGIPLGLLVDQNASSDATFNFSVVEQINFTPNNIYIYDTIDDVYYNITRSSQGIQLPSGHASMDRFEIRFKDTSNTLSNDTIDELGFTVFQNNRKQNLTVFNPELQNVSNISLYDLSGRLIFNEKPSTAQTEYTFNTATLSSALYIVKVTTKANKEAAIKISIAN